MLEVVERCVFLPPCHWPSWCSMSPRKPIQANPTALLHPHASIIGGSCVNPPLTTAFRYSHFGQPHHSFHCSVKVRLKAQYNQGPQHTSGQG